MQRPATFLRVIDKAVVLWFGIGVDLFGSTQATQEPAETRPNFLFVLVDDLGWKDLGCYGSHFYETPNIDKLAATGVRFTRAYAACPVCSPTRASIMTGKYPARLGVTDYISPSGTNQPDKWKRKTKLLPAQYVDRLQLSERTIAEALQEAGYATFFAGKWHLGPEGFWPEDQGFDVNQGGIDRGGPYGGKRYFSPYGNPRLKDGPEGEHLPDRLATETIRFIKEHRDTPHFAFLSFYSVHTPLMTRPDLRAKYQRKREAVGEDVWGQEGPRKLRMIQNHAVYAGMIEAMDMAVGRVLDALEQLQLDERTIVIFMSDNGGLSTSEGHPTSNLPLRAGKGWLYEGGVREPMIVRWPAGGLRGAVCDQVVTSVDFYPTILELASLPADDSPDIDGVSMVPHLKGTHPGLHEAIYWHYPHYGNQGGTPGAAILVEPWKLIEYFEEDRIELYRIDLDPGETKDLKARHPEKAQALHSQLDTWQEAVGASFPVENPRYSQQ